MLFRVIGTKTSLRSFPFTFSRKMTTMSSNSFKIACIQLAVGSNKRTNLDRAKGKILEAARGGANVIVLPVSVKFISK